MNPAFQLTIDQDGIGKVLFDLPGEKVNKLNREVIEQLHQLLDELKDNKEICALLILSGKKDLFIAGADLNEFLAVFEDPSIAEELLTSARQALFKLQALPVPTIALIHGICVGGGLELALLCDYRIGTDHPKTSLSFPETSLGIFPGWGGTQTAPRLIGLMKATEMIISGKSLDACKAYQDHLVDQIVPAEFAEERAVEFARQILTKKGKKAIRRRRKLHGALPFLLEKNPIGRAFLFSQFRKAIRHKTKGFYPAPLIALEVIEKSHRLPLEQGLKIELDSFLKLIKENIEIPRNLITIFFEREKLKKAGAELPSVTDPADAALLGAGTMGGGICYLFAKAQIPVRMKDLNWEMIGRGIGTVWELFQKAVKRKRMKPGIAEVAFHKTSWTLDYSGFEKKDFILEAIVEEPEIKHQVYKQLEPIISKEAIIATNTSSLRVDELASQLEHPERFIGMHFFNPAPLMPLVEIVKGERTSNETLAKTLALAKKLGKIPLIVKDCHGFLVNRILLLGAFEAVAMIGEGSSPEQIDQAALAFGMPMGLCEVIDLTGVDVCTHAAHIFEKAYGERMAVPPLLDTLYEAKCYGKKTGKGFYLYSSKKVNPLIKISNKKVDFDRILFAMINEATRCLEEQIVTQASHIDLALILGAGFPPFRGGLLRYADKLGLQTVHDKLQSLTPISTSRFTPTQMITSMAEEGRKFYP